MRTANTQQLKGFKVYEFYFKGSDKIHFAIAKSKSDLENHYLNDLRKIYVRKDIDIDESMNYAPLIIKDSRGFNGLSEITLEEFVN